jgi:hypothetical protein
MTKPDWKDAPKWARYVAMDSGGAWYWYEGMPKLGSTSHYSNGHKYELAHTEEYPGWDRTLEARP